MNFQGVELCCPCCRGDLAQRDGAATESALVCAACGRSFPVVLGIPDLRVFPDPYISVEDDYEKGRRVAAREELLSFTELIDYYYSITSAVPAHHARLYTRGLLAATSRAQSALEAWRQRCGVGTRSATLLDVGCGTGPLLVAAAARYQQAVGVDIAFRWLVVARKRLAEAGVTSPLICACAEALPFPDSAFDHVALDSTLEHVDDQTRSMAECFRVMRPDGCLFLSTPNRFSLGPDPQVGVWGGGLIPSQLLAAYVRLQGGVPPRRRLLAARRLGRLAKGAGFEAVRVFAPDVPEGQRRHFGASMRILIDLYRLARRLPLSRNALLWIGPLLNCVARKPRRSGATPSAQPANERAIECPSIS